MPSASMVCCRFPPPSWFRMMAPGRVLVRITWVMWWTPGWDQSRGSTDQSSGRSPAPLQAARIAGDQPPPGARKRVGRTPAVSPLRVSEEPGSFRTVNLLGSMLTGLVETSSARLRSG